MNESNLVFTESLFTGFFVVERIFTSKNGKHRFALGTVSPWKNESESIFIIACSTRRGEYFDAWTLEAIGYSKDKMLKIYEKIKKSDELGFCALDILSAWDGKPEKETTSLEKFNSIIRFVCFTDHSKEKIEEFKKLDNKLEGDQSLS